ncbi:hypothetical protein BHU09_03710 [Tannerella sp. oral taxon 808]|nr:hypothetical protein BHU09_03710 [Tannerella sp. oral taxon 808]
MSKRKRGSLVKELRDENARVGIYEQVDHPLFSFKYLQEDSIDKYDVNKGGKPYFDFLMRLKKLSELGWKVIRTSGRHGFGMEKVSRSRIIPQKPLPPFITPEVEDLHVFRSKGDNTALVGWQMEKVFYIFYIELRHGDIYRHS